MGSMGVLGVKMSEGGAVSRREERTRKHLSVFGRSGFGKVLGLSSWAHNGSAGALSLSLVRDAPDEVEHVLRF